MMDGDTDKIGTLLKGSGGVPTGTAELGLDKPSPPMEVEEDEVIAGDQDDPGQLVLMTENGAGEKLGQGAPLTGAELEAKVKELEAIVEEQRKSLEESEKENRDLQALLGSQKITSMEMMEASNTQIRKLKKRLKTAKQMFKQEWSLRSLEWKRKKEELAIFRKEGEGLLKTVEGLKRTLLQKYREANGKDDAIRKLARKVGKLKDDDGSPEKRKTIDLLKIPQGGILPRTGRKVPEAVFPEEIWGMIIGNLKDPKDLWSLCNTCQLFDAILETWRTKYLFEQALPHLYRHLPGNKLLECRLVCKSWKRGVDTHLESHPSIRPHTSGIDPRRLEFVNPVEEKGICTQKEFNFCSPKDSSILKDPDIPRLMRGNLFIDRWVNLNLCMYDFTTDPEGNKLENLLGKASQFLKTYGEEIWYLGVWFPSSAGALHHGSLIKQKVTKFVTVDLLPLVPNLRKLDVIGTHGYGHSIFAPRKLPPAPKLETIEASAFTEGPELTVHAMLRTYHVQLRKLHLNSRIWRRVTNLEWPNLKELHLSNIGSLEDLRSLYGDGVRMPQLTKLGLNFGAPVHDAGLTFTALLECIREVSLTTSLNTLRLDGILDAMRLGQVVGTPSAPETMKTLEIDHWWGDPDLPNSNNYTFLFLLSHFPLIQNMHLFFRNCYEFYETEFGLGSREDIAKVAVEEGFEMEAEIVEINKYIYDGGMYKSNIWELLPRLKVFSFQWDVYTRHEFEAYKRREEKAGNN